LKRVLKKLDTRKMILNKLYIAKKFEYFKKYNYNEYKERALEIEKKYYQDISQIPINKIEEDYWKICLNTDEKNENEIDYAADVPLKNYFSKQELVKLNNDLSNKSWNLLSINTQKKFFVSIYKTRR